MRKTYPFLFLEKTNYKHSVNDVQSCVCKYPYQMYLFYLWLVNTEDGVPCQEGWDNDIPWLTFLSCKYCDYFKMAERGTQIPFLELGDCLRRLLFLNIKLGL